MALTQWIFPLYKQLLCGNFLSKPGSGHFEVHINTVHNWFKIRWVLWLLGMIFTRRTSPLGPTPRSAQKAGSCIDRLSVLRSNPLLYVFNAENSGQGTGHWGRGRGGDQKGGGRTTRGWYPLLPSSPPTHPQPLPLPPPQAHCRNTIYFPPFIAS